MHDGFKALRTRGTRGKDALVLLRGRIAHCQRERPRLGLTLCCADIAAPSGVSAVRVCVQTLREILQSQPLLNFYANHTWALQHL